MTIPCPHCGHARSFVTQSRHRSGERNRRRKCKQCGRTFGTIEISQAYYDYLKIASEAPTPQIVFPQEVEVRPHRTPKQKQKSLTQKVKVRPSRTPKLTPQQKSLAREFPGYWTLYKDLYGQSESNVSKPEILSGLITMGLARRVRERTARSCRWVVKTDRLSRDEFWRTIQRYLDGGIAS